MNRPHPTLSPQPPLPDPRGVAQSRTFFPRAPRTLEETGLELGAVQAMILKFLSQRRVARGSEIAAALHLPLPVVDEPLSSLQRDRLVAYKGTAGHADFVYEIAEEGKRRALEHLRDSGYVGPAPVPLDDYRAAMTAQSVRRQHPTLEDLRRTYAGLSVADRMLSRLGQAIRAGSALFLYGQSGNGKTSLAERISDCFGRLLWIPHALTIDGEVVRLFDAKLHEEFPADELPAGDFDRRWVPIRRPSIVVGGELTMENLELSITRSHVVEAPIQLKSNGGTLVVDDFGRQRMRPAELLNRWIIPLEKGHDILQLPGGRTFHVPFDQMLVFATNLEPSELVDDAFLRRIPYKLEVHDPTEEQFRTLLLKLAQQQGIDIASSAVDYLITRHYRAVGRPLRFCHPRDLLRQVEVYCAFHDCSAELNQETIDAAAENYFAVLAEGGPAS